MVRKVYRTRRSPVISYRDFQGLYRKAMDEFFGHHKPPGHIRTYFRRHADSICKRLYNRLTPLLEEFLSKTRKTRKDRASAKEKPSTARRQRENKGSNQRDSA